MAKRLGSNLDSIFDDDLFGGDSGSSGIQTLLIGQVEPNRDQPRKDFDQGKLEELAGTIREHGIVQPITVREHGENFQIVAGERRWRAARIAGLDEVPVRIMELTDSQTMQIALMENLQREDLNAVEEAQGYRELIDNYKMTQEKLAEVVGKARSSVTNSLRLLTLPDEVLDLVRGGKLSKGHCKAIMSADSTKRMIALANMAVNERLSVREVERLAQREVAEKTPKTSGKITPFFRETELALGQALGTKVKIVDGKAKKTLCIEFADEEQLKNIIKNFS
jgi:ParB family chromosome partitioning protein